MESVLTQILNETEAVPFAEINGRQVYTFKDAQKVNKRVLAEEKLTGKSMELGEREMMPDGIHFKRTKAHALAINPERFFANKYRISEKTNGKPQLEVVLDYLCIKGQETNNIPKKNITVFVLGKHGRGNGITLLKKDVISDVEFVNEFKKSIPIIVDGGINKQIVDVYNAVERAKGEDEKHEDLEQIFG